MLSQWIRKSFVVPGLLRCPGAVKERLIDKSGVVEDCRFRVAAWLHGLRSIMLIPAIDRSGVLYSFCGLDEG